MGTLLYSEADLAQLRWKKVYLPAFQGEIPMPPAPSYQQVREPAATKQSPQRVVAPDTSLESPKAKHSSSKGGPSWGSGCSSNTSTPKHPDSTSAKKPSCPKEPTPDCQAKSPWARSSCKHGRLPSPASGSAGCKRRDLCGVDSSTADITLPIGSSMSDTFHSLMGSLSDMIEPLAPSITSTTLVRPVPERGERPPLTAGTHQHCSLPAQASAYPAILL